MPVYTELSFDHPFWQHKRPLIDSRSLLFPEQSLFFALEGRRSDGHDYLEELYARGVCHFVVQRVPTTLKQNEAIKWLCVNDVLGTLQHWAQYHREQFPTIPLLAITGSNGKTMIKEGLSQLLAPKKRLVKSPKSYNSQIGVPLSVLQIRPDHELAIFEAGISQVGEMQRLASILQPTLGLLTNLGAAHASGFASAEEKLLEKLRLFEGADRLVYCCDQTLVHQIVSNWSRTLDHPPQCYTWGACEEATLPLYTQIQDRQTRVRLEWKGETFAFFLNTTSAAMVENRLHQLAVLMAWGWTAQAAIHLLQGLEALPDVPMRLAYKEAINGSYLIDDSYNNDLEGLSIGVDFLSQKAQHSTAYTKTLILSDLPDLHSEAAYQYVADLLLRAGVERLLGVGPQLMQYQALFSALPRQHFYSNTHALLQALERGDWTIKGETVLLKGARVFRFEHIATALQKRLHRTVLEVDLQALAHNVHCYRQHLAPSTRLMVMVKASAYGSGAYAIAQLLEYLQVDYLGVAYLDEGIALRKKGIRLPIMVMNTTPREWDLAERHRLEPVVYSLDGMKAYTQRAVGAGEPLGIHLELDTGMHRLGLVESELDEVVALLSASVQPWAVKGIFSHLAAADAPEHDAFTREQLARFEDWSQRLLPHLPTLPLRHVLNSAGIQRFPDAQYDLVRLGIGVYGLLSDFPLEPVLRLKTTIAQLKTVGPAATVGYSRRGLLPEGSRLAVLSIGYADGFLRGLGNGAASVYIRGKAVPTVGNVCMDMCFVDVSQVPEVQEGDEVIIFENCDQVTHLAEALDTIPYEVLTNLSERLPRIFYEA